jgi:hypothetical protein
MNQPKYQIGQGLSNMTFTYGGDGRAIGECMQEGIIRAIQQCDDFWNYVIEPLNDYHDGYWVSPTVLKEENIFESTVTPVDQGKIILMAQRSEQKGYGAEALKLYALLQNPNHPTEKPGGLFANLGDEK